MSIKRINSVSLVFSYITMMLIMIALGASDSMRGIFSPVFKEHFSLDSAGFSLIVTVSYVGNFVFLLFGSRLADKFGLKRVFLCVLLCWICAVLLYIVTDDYYVLLCCMFVTMGSSTLMNTFVNLLCPILFVASPQLAVNTLFFVQGIGTSGAQALAGNFASTFYHWKITNLILISMGALALILLLFMKLPRDSEKIPKAESSSEKKGVFSQVLKNEAFILLVLMFGFYFIAEHGLLNWLVLYCTGEFSMSQGKASVYLSLFYGGMTVGRLFFAPFLKKLGTEKSIKFFGGIGAIVYVTGLVGAVIAGFVTGGGRISEIILYLLSLSGLLVSILYPMMVLFIRNFFHQSIISTATGAIISIATLFDISFNLIFGKLADKVGFTYIILILPVSMIIFYAVFRSLYKKAGKAA